MVVVSWTNWCSRSIMTSFLWSYRYSPNSASVATAPSIAYTKDKVQREGRKKKVSSWSSPILLSRKMFLRTSQKTSSQVSLSRTRSYALNSITDNQEWGDDAQIRANMSHPPGQSFLLGEGGFCSPGDIRHCLETFLTVTTWGGGCY